MKKSKIENSLELFFFCRKGTLYCPKGLVGRGYPRGTSFLLDLLWGSGTHYETGPGFLLLFSIKSKEERLCFAVKVLNWRVTHLHCVFLLSSDLRRPLRQILHRIEQLPLPINPIMQMRPCGKPRIP